VLRKDAHTRPTSWLAPLLTILAIGLAASFASSAGAQTRSATPARHGHTNRPSTRHDKHAARHVTRRRKVTKKHSPARTLGHTPGKSPSPTAPTAPVSSPVATFPAQPAPSPAPTEAVSGSSGSHAAPAVSTTCNMFASPSGSDSGNGSSAHPFLTVTKLDQALAPGETGCLRGGTYGNINTKYELSNSGTPSAQIAITAYPGETATVVGWIDIAASYTTLSGLEIDGSNTFYNKASGSPCPTPHTVSQALDIAGTGDVFERNDYYQSVAALRGTGIGVGFWGDADNTTIRYNRIHDVGQCTQHDHLIYLASGNNVQIYDNWMYNDHNGFGVTAYPAPTNAQIFSNVIDNAGSGLNFGDNGTSTTRGNKAWHNVVTNAFRVRGDAGEALEASLVMCAELDASSTGNEIFENDSFDNADGISAVNSHLSSADIALRANISADPRFENIAANDYDIAPGSPVSSWGLWNGD
jgi:hypothetical protein